MSSVTGDSAGVIETTAGRRVIFASSLGTVFEWYDFYIYGTLATFFGALFFSAGNETAALSSLATVRRGLLVRPFGALVFGRIGDLVGRKYTFLVTIVVMGARHRPGRHAADLCQTIGFAAPVILVLLRLLAGPRARRRVRRRRDLRRRACAPGQARAVHELDPDDRDARPSSSRWPSSYVARHACRPRPSTTGAGASRSSSRSSCSASPSTSGSSWRSRRCSQEMKAEGKTSKAPLTESFANWSNAKIVLLALFGATAGQGVVWYTGQFYALFFLTRHSRSTT